MLKEWRDETKRLKQKKYFESLKKGTKGMRLYQAGQFVYFVFYYAHKVVGMGFKFF